MLRIVNLEEIQTLLLRVPGLVHALEARESGFAGAVKEWLVQTEQVLTNNRMPAAAEVATLRGALISAERGVLPPGLTFLGRPTSRKVKDAAAADVLRKAQELVSGAVRADAAQVAEAQRLARQVVSVAQRKGLAEVMPAGGTHTERLAALWSAMLADPDVGSATVHLGGLVGSQDALVLLDRALSSAA